MIYEGVKEMAEKSKKWAIVVVGLLLIAVIISAGCVEETPTEEGGASQPSTAEETSTETSAAEGTSLSDIFGKAESIASVRYDVVITSPGNPSVTFQQWVKGNKVRMEMPAEGKTMIIIVNLAEGVSYIYNPEENIAMKMEVGTDTQSAVEDVLSIQSRNPTVVGTETIDGKLCTVVEYTSLAGDEVKTWLWQKGLPVRMEVTTTEGTSRTEWKNFGFGDIPDDKFKLPAGVEVREMRIPSIPEGMG